MKKSKKIISIVLVLCLTVVITACNSSSEGVGGNSSKEFSTKGTTLMYGSNDYTRINPAIDEHGEINALLFDGLTDHDKDNHIVPGLATSWDYDKSTYTYIFHLRKGVKWHDGKDFTAEDVKFTIEKIMDPKNESEIRSNYEDIKKIKVIDDYTISFTLKNTNVAFLEYMTIGILPKHLLENEDMQNSNYFKFPIGTGPYKMKKWDKGQSIILVKNKDYYKGPPKIDNVVFKITDDDRVQSLQLKTGELDLALVTPTLAQQFKNNDKYKLHTMETADYRGIMYNFKSPFWQKNRNLIKAFNYAFNREAMLKTVLLDEGEVAYGPLQKNKYNDENVEKYNYNPKKSKQLIEAAGWTMGDDGYYQKDGQRLSFELSTNENEQERIDLANMAAQSLKEVGVECKVNITSNIDWENQDAFLIGWGSPFDADVHTYKVFVTDQGNNYNYFSNSNVDKYLTLARQTANQSERSRYYKDFQKELANDPPYSFLVYLDANYVASTHISGISEQTVLGHHGVGIFWNIEEWSIEK
ncbi:ABC transporter substrate-binding protein [Rummeliibacillus pycnus]|uniref:ABC transporter substrate-binding protein n=1 Tax=Rummeliibacillus pycnus TaxID=101070 RepID=UPI0037C68837